MDLYGGAKYGGIEPADESSNVFLYTDPEVGARFGYDFDGDPDGSGEVFFYTGMGKRGDQQLSARNGSVLNHVEDRRSLRLFEFTGRSVEGSQTKLHEYLGEFRIDESDPFTIEDALDEDDEQRTVIVFKLRPVGAVKTSDRSRSSAVPSATSHADLVDVESNEVEEFEQRRSDETVVARKREAELTKEFRVYLEAKGHEVKRYRLTVPSSISPLFTDEFDLTDGVLYEAKASASRQSIRMAIGQLFDYRRYIDRDDVSLSVLVPTRPSDDMIDLLASLDIGCVVRSGRSDFVAV
jgi:hypothetical protein